MNEEYNGWSNRETWATALWINNEQALYESVKDQTRAEIEGHDEGEEINPAFLADFIEEFIDDLFDESWDSLKAMRNDIGSLYRVNWYEIAESFISELKVNA